MRVDAMMGEAEGEDEKTLMIQSLRAMVDGLKRQVLRALSYASLLCLAEMQDSLSVCGRCWC